MEKELHVARESYKNHKLYLKSKVLRSREMAQWLKALICKASVDGLGTATEYPCKAKYTMWLMLLKFICCGKRP